MSNLAFNLSPDSSTNINDGNVQRNVHVFQSAIKEEATNQYYEIRVSPHELDVVLAFRNAGKTDPVSIIHMLNNTSSSSNYNQYEISPQISIARVVDKDIKRGLTNLFHISQGEIFRDGMDSAFSLKLQELISSYGNKAIGIIEDAIFDNKFDANVISEGLRWIGKIEKQQTHLARRRLLEDCLQINSSIIKDGAILGLSFLDDPESIYALEEAFKRESNQSLREDIEQVLDQLEDTKEMLR